MLVKAYNQWHIKDDKCKTETVLLCTGAIVCRTSITSENTRTDKAPYCKLCKKPIPDSLKQKLHNR